MTKYYLVFALERFIIHDVLQRYRISHPLQHLPGGHYPHVLHGDDRVQEQLEALLVMWGGKPEKILC